MNKKTMITGLLAIMLILGAGSAATFNIVVETKKLNGDYVICDKFDTSEDVYVWGYGLTNNVDVYIVSDRDWENGDTITEGDIVASKLGTNINTQHVRVWSNPIIVGEYDVFVDTNNNKIYDFGVDAIDSASIVGFEVVPEADTIVLMGAGLLSMIGYIGIRRIHCV